MSGSPPCLKSRRDCLTRACSNRRLIPNPKNSCAICNGIPVYNHVLGSGCTSISWNWYKAAEAPRSRGSELAKYIGRYFAPKVSTQQGL
jgi:hypothetical protein